MIIILIVGIAIIGFYAAVLRSRIEGLSMELVKASRETNFSLKDQKEDISILVSRLNRQQEEIEKTKSDIGDINWQILAIKGHDDFKQPKAEASKENPVRF